jgi:TorA maturation chaperone TorD
MRDPGLEQAVRAVGGVSELARQIGISQPSVSNWNKVPAERVLIVEEATGVNRKILRPDLYQSSDEVRPTNDDVATARAQEYALLATLLARAPNAALLAKLATMRGDATPLGLAHAALAQAADGTTVERVETEYFNLFIGVGRGELLPYGSYYLTGFLHERPLARLRGDLAPLGIERVDGNYEPEDHVANLCVIMARLVSGDLAAPEGTDQQIFE